MGWGEAKFNYESMQYLHGKFSRNWSKFSEKMMYLFGVTEQFNRYATIYGAYYAKNGTKAVADFEHEMHKAHEISDMVHGVYDKANKPWLVQKLPLLRGMYTFQTYSHNFVNTVLVLGKHGISKKRMAPVLFAAFSPAIVGGLQTGVHGLILTPIMAMIGKIIGSDDPWEDFYSWLNGTFGVTAEYAARYGVFGMGGVDITGSLDIRPTIPKTAWDWLGAPAGVYRDVARGISDIMDGSVFDGMARILPTSAGAIIKSAKDYYYGVTSKNAPVFLPDGTPLKLSSWQLIMEAMAFRPADKALVADKTWNYKKTTKYYRDWRNKLYKRIRNAYFLNEGEIDEKTWMKLNKDIMKYNDAAVRGRYVVPMITMKSIRNNINMRLKPQIKERREIAP